MTNNHETTGEPVRIETPAAENLRRAAILDRRGRDQLRKDDAWLAEPHNELVATPATTARASATKIGAHANLQCIGGKGDAISIVEASAFGDARL